MMVEIAVEQVEQQVVLQVEAVKIVQVVKWIILHMVLNVAILRGLNLE